MQKHPQLPQAFAELGVEVRFLKALQKMGFTEPTEVQVKMIPMALQGRDILGQARTGTGKTAAFGLPVLQQIDPSRRLQAICLAPTRELAVQVTAELRRLASATDLHIVPVYGGQKVATQLHHLGRKPHFVVGTPGRVLDFMERRVLDISKVGFVILDEVDRMLDIGFRDDIKRILSRVTARHQTIFVSATIDEQIRRLAQPFMRDPVTLDVSRDRLTVEEVDQSYISVEGYDKFHLLRMLLSQEQPPIAIVFCRTKHTARKLSKKLHDAGINAKEIHGDLMQRKRDHVMEQFRKHQIRILVATDLASRGIDVSAISHIINYDVPEDPEVYVHRIGRTGRMGAKGTAITFVTKEQGKEITNIEKLINQEIRIREIKGFVPRPAPERVGRASPGTPWSAPSPGAASSDTSTQTATKKPKTLGGRFRPARRRRL